MRSSRSGLLGLAFVVGLTPVAAAETGAWQVFDNTAPAEGPPSYAALLKADNTVSGSEEEAKAPTLALTCDRAGLALTFIWPDLIDKVPGQAMAMIQWKLDDSIAQNADWPATARSVSESAGQAVKWARAWSAGKTLTVHIPDEHGGQEATFQLTGLSDVMGRVSRLTCGSGVS